MQRSTRQRAAIEAVLRTANRPLAPGEVLAEARVSVPALGTATVYRTLRALMEEGVVSAVHLPGEAPRYELAQLGHHHHFRCRRCERVFEVEGCPGDLATLAPPGFHVDAHEVVLFGSCAACAGARP